MICDVIVTSNNQKDFSKVFLEANTKSIKFNFSPSCFQVKTSDQNKIKELKRVINNNNEIILAMRGGSGATRIMDEIININLPQTSKIFIGYSDLTVLLNYFTTNTNYQVIHGPMAFELTNAKRINKFIDAIVQKDVIFDRSAKWFSCGELSGEVMGGNLLVLCNMLATNYEPEFTNKILLIEEINEPIDKLDRMFAQLRDSGKLQVLKGIILGQFTSCAQDDELLALFEYYLRPLNIPVLMDVNLGHIEDSDYIHFKQHLQIDETGIYY